MFPSQWSRVWVEPWISSALPMRPRCVLAPLDRTDLLAHSNSRRSSSSPTTPTRLAVPRLSKSALFLSPVLAACPASSPSVRPSSHSTDLADPPFPPVAVFDVDRVAGELTLIELAPGVTEEEVRAKTGATYHISKDLKTMEE